MKEYGPKIANVSSARAARRLGDKGDGQLLHRARWRPHLVARAGFARTVLASPAFMVSPAEGGERIVTRREPRVGGKTAATTRRTAGEPVPSARTAPRPKLWDVSTPRSRDVGKSGQTRPSGAKNWPCASERWWRCFRVTRSGRLE